MRKLFVLLTMFAFCSSPAAFGAPITAQQLYKNTYIELKQGKDAGQVLRNLVDTAKRNNIEIKQVLEAAVAKGYMSQEQLNTVLDVAAKNAHIANDKAMVEKLQANKLSAADLKEVTKALQGQVTGAAYHCGYYGCYHDAGVVYFLVVILLLACIVTPTYYVVVY